MKSKKINLNIRFYYLKMKTPNKTPLPILTGVNFIFIKFLYDTFS
jgi:hypothetical protein